jgi:hypothetical protein
MQSGIQSFIGSGDLYIDRLTGAGVSTGFVKTGNVVKMAVQVETETKKLTSKGRDTYGQTLAEIPRITGTNISLTVNQQDVALLAAQTMGEAVELSGAGGTVPAEALVAAHDKYVELAHGGISAVTVKGSATSIITGNDSTFASASNWVNVDIGTYDEATDLSLTATAEDQYCTLPVANAGTTSGKKYRLTFTVANLVGSWTIKDFDGTNTLGTVTADGAQVIDFTAASTGGLRIVANTATASADFDTFTLFQRYDVNTDYTVNTRLGAIQALSTGTIANAGTVYVDYTWAAETGYKITVATQPVVKVALRLDGKNDYDGSSVIVKVWEAHLRPASELDFLADDWNEIQFEGEMITPDGYSWPCEII